MTEKRGGVFLMPEKSDCKHCKSSHDGQEQIAKFFSAAERTNASIKGSRLRQRKPQRG